jgi:Fe2+ transport system protein FeoA
LSKRNGFAILVKENKRQEAEIFLWKDNFLSVSAIRKEEFYMTLADLNPGERGITEQIDLAEDMRRRMQDLGLHAGTIVECYAKLGKCGPSVYRILESLIALRREDGEKISVILNHNNEGIDL